MAAGVQFFERVAEHAGVQQRRPLSRQVPARLVGPDGRLHLGMPLESQADAAGRRDAASGAQQGGAADAANAANAGMVVLMNPGPACASDGPAILPRRQLVAILLCDLVALLLLFSDLSWRTVYVGRLSIQGVAGLLAVGLGFAGCVFPRPRLLGLLFVVALVQFFAGVMLLQTRWQLIHCFTQPIVAHAALSMRHALIPAWFAVGRAGRPMGPGL